MLPPTMRQKKRYVALEIRSAIKLKRDDVISLIWDGANYMYGACGNSCLDLWLVKIWNCNSPEDYWRFKVLVRCNPNEIKTVLSIFPSITKFKGKRIVIHTLGISGTIKSATKKFIKTE